MKVSIMAKVRIKKMTEADVKDVVRIEQTTFSAPWSYESFVQELDHMQAYYKVILCDEQIIGYGGFWKILDEGHITNIAIQKEQRHCGYGTQLIQDLIREAEKHKIKNMTLEVRESNMHAIKAYQKLGFIIEGKRLGYYTKPNEDAIIMWLSL